MRHMENPETWDPIDRALNEMWDEVLAEVMQGTCGLSPGRRIRDILGSKGFRIIRAEVAPDTLEPLGLFKRWTEND